MTRLTTAREPELIRCDYCGGSGYLRGHWGDLECPECEGAGEWLDDDAEARIKERLDAKTEGELRFTIEQARDAA